MRKEGKGREGKKKEESLKMQRTKLGRIGGACVLGDPDYKAAERGF